MFRNEHLIPIFGWEHQAGVKSHAESGDMRAEFYSWRRERPITCLSIEFRISNAFTMDIREAEM